jgi:hypothetical protein
MFDFSLDHQVVPLSSHVCSGKLVVETTQAWASISCSAVVSGPPRIRRIVRWSARTCCLAASAHRKR